MKWISRLFSIIILAISLASKAEQGTPLPNLIYTDSDFDSAISQNKNLLFYIWSPQMILSQQGLAEIIELTRKTKVSLEVLADPNASTKRVAELVQQNRWPPSAQRAVQANALIKLGVRIHFPSYIFVKNGKIVTLVPGYKGEQQLNALIKEFFK